MGELRAPPAPHPNLGPSWIAFPTWCFGAVPAFLIYNWGWNPIMVLAGWCVCCLQVLRHCALPDSMWRRMQSTDLLDGAFLFRCASAGWRISGDDTNLSGKLWSIDGGSVSSICDVFCAHCRWSYGFNLANIFCQGNQPQNSAPFILTVFDYCRCLAVWIGDCTLVYTFGLCLYLYIHIAI